MHNHSRFLLALAASTSACGIDSSTTEFVADDNLEVQASETSPPETWVDHKGRTWVRQGPAQFSEGADSDEFPAHPDPNRPRMIEMTVDEIAMRMRPVTSLWGYVYMVEEPNYAEAERIKSGEPSPEIIRPQGLPVEQADLNEGPPDLPPATVFGPDDRTRVSSNTLWPYSATGLITLPAALTIPPFSGSAPSCTNSLIGRSTAVSAAHCYLGEDPQTFTTHNSWGYGIDRLDSNPYPFGLWTGCFFVFFNSGAWNAGGAQHVDVEDDFAVVEFSDLYPGGCNLYPGDSTGFLGWGTVSSSIIDNQLNYVIGYPKWTSTRSYDWPSMWYAARNDSTPYSYYIEHHTDTTAGQSGGPLYVRTSNMWVVAGVHVRSGPSNNTARRLDGTFFNWICDYGDMGC